MKYKVATIPQFDKDLKRLAKKHRSIKQDVAALEDLLTIDPKMGDEVIKNCYKIRLAITSKGKGKSGGARVIIYVWMQETTVILLTIYDKGEQESIDIATIKELLKGIGVEK